MSPRSDRRAVLAATACALVWTLATSRAGLSAQIPGGSGPPPPDFVANELIVRVADPIAGAKLAEVLNKLNAVDQQRSDSVNGLHVLELPPGLSVAAAKQLAQQIDGVIYAEPNYIVRTQAIPNDASFGELWGLHNTGQSGGTVGADIQAVDAWNLSTGSSSVVVAILDTGIDYAHPDLVGNVFRNEADCNTNGIDDEGNGSIDDCHGIDTVNHDGDPLDDHNHGSHVAGTIGASGNDGVGVVGVNWTIKMMACKFLGANGSGTTADAVSCLDYVAHMKDLGVNIVATNNSWGGGGFSQALYDAIDAQRQRGILFIAAAGNGGLDNAGDDNGVTPHYPASYDLPNVIAVANTTRTDALSSSSNFGRRSVHLGAPGSAILSTVRNNGYATFSGTSMATPHVTGVAALLKAQDPARDWRAIRNLLLAGGDANPNLASVTVTGKRLNAYGSMTCTDATLLTRLKPVQNVVTATPGETVVLAAQHNRCGAANGDVIVTVSPGGGTITLTDTGTGLDKVAGDAIYSGTFVPATTGSYVLAFPAGDTVSLQVLIPASYSYQATTFAYRTITGTSLSLADDTSAAISPPFPIRFGGGMFDTLFVSSNGNLNFVAAFDEFINQSLPLANPGSALIAAFWDDLVPSGILANVFWDTAGVAPQRELVIEWRGLPGYSCTEAGPVTFQVVLFEDRHDILFNYADVMFGGSCMFRDGAGSATIGVQTSSTVSRLFSVNQASVSDGLALLWTLSTNGFTDDPLIAQETRLKAIHITELRARVNAARAKFNLAAKVWTDATLVPGATAAIAQHVIELRTAVTEAFQAANLTAPTFTDLTLSPGVSVIRAVHIQELRSAVVVLEQ